MPCTHRAPTAAQVAVLSGSGPQSSEEEVVGQWDLLQYTCLNEDGNVDTQQPTFDASADVIWHDGALRCGAWVTGCTRLMPRHACCTGSSPWRVRYVVWPAGAIGDILRVGRRRVVVLAPLSEPVAWPAVRTFGGLRATVRVSLLRCSCVRSVW